MGREMKLLERKGYIERDVSELGRREGGLEEREGSEVVRIAEAGV
jgi:hypothetical protein